MLKDTRFEGECIAELVVDGERVRKMRYRMPAPGYTYSPAESSRSSAIVLNDILPGVWMSAVKNEHFCVILNEVSQGLGDEIVADHEVGMTWESSSGQTLAGLLMTMQSNGVFPVFVRTVEIPTKARREMFLQAFRDNLQQMQKDSERIQAVTDIAQEKTVTPDIRRRYGVSFRVKKLSQSEPLPIQEMKRLLTTLVGYG